MFHMFTYIRDNHWDGVFCGTAPKQMTVCVDLLYNTSANMCLVKIANKSVRGQLCAHLSKCCRYMCILFTPKVTIFHMFTYIRDDHWDGIFCVAAPKQMTTCADISHNTSGQSCAAQNMHTIYRRQLHTQCACVAGTYVFFFSLNTWVFPIFTLCGHVRLEAIVWGPVPKWMVICINTMHDTSGHIYAA